MSSRLNHSTDVCPDCHQTIPPDTWTHRFECPRTVSVPKFECALCNGLLFLSYQGVKLHILVKHRSPGAAGPPRRRKNAKTGHQCDECGKHYTALSDFMAHRYRYHTGERPFRCDQCANAYTSLAGLQMHQRIHANQRSEFCPECGKGFYNRSSLKVHRRQHSGEAPYECDLCGRRTKQASNLLSHYRHAHKNTEITVKTIRARARQQNELMNAASSDQPTPSPTIEPNANLSCKPMTSSEQPPPPPSSIEASKKARHFAPPKSKIKITADRNATGHHSKWLDSTNTTNDGAAATAFDYLLVDLKCEDVDDDDDDWDDDAHVPNDEYFGDVDKSSVTDSNESKSSLQPPKDEDTDGGDAIADDYLLVELKVEAADVNATNAQHIYVELEADTADDESTKAQHIYEELKADKADDESTSNAHVVYEPIQFPIAERTYECHRCHCTSTSAHTLRSHLRTVHKRVRTPQICYLCGKLVKSLYHHLELHRQLPHVCPDCPDGRFRTAERLLVHRSRRHTDEPLFVCDSCPARFRLREGLRLHRRQHTGERPYACSHCEKCFRARAALVEHERLHTGERPFSCHLCEKRFAQIGNLRSHLRHLHKVESKGVRFADLETLKEPTKKEEMNKRSK